jgi:hypothetical protein
VLRVADSQQICQAERDKNHHAPLKVKKMKKAKLSFFLADESI